MKSYVLTAYDTRTRKIVTETLRYERPSDVYAYAREHAYVGIDINDDATPSFNESRFRGDKIRLFRELALYLDRGIPREEIKTDLCRHWDERSSFYPIVEGFLTDLATKDPVFRAMAKRPDVFSETEVELLHLGWEKGREVEALNQIVRYLKRDDTVARKVKAASWYPSVLLVGMLASFTIYNWVMLPQLRQLYATLNIKPVWPLPWLFAIYDFLSSPLHDALLAVLLVGCAFGVVLWARTDRGAAALDNFRLNMPLFGELEYRKRLINALYIVQLMVDAGERAGAIIAARRASRGPVFRNALARIQDDLDQSKARSWAGAWEKAPEIAGPRLLGLIRSGDRHGLLPEKLGEAIEDEYVAIDETIAALPEKLQTLATILFVPPILAILYVIVVPTSNATAHLH